MSLATRCTACNTVFRVVQDQLKVSQGWVRCGRCGAVFNALEGLFDLDPAPTTAPEAPAPAPATAALGMPEAAPAADTADVPAAAPAELPPATEARAMPAAAAPHWDEPWAPDVATPATIVSDPGPAQVEAHRPGNFAGSGAGAASDATPASRVDEADRIDFADARFNTALLAEEGIVTGDSSLEGMPLADAAAPPLIADGAPPEFLRKAERTARWSSPRARWTLSLLCLMLLLVLALQVLLHYRDLVATLLPESRPALQAACEVLQCRIEPLRRIDDIVIESSSLNALPGSDAVRLSVVLRNRGVFPLALPAIELTLTDAGGQMIARRILPPSDFGAGASAVLPAASELPLQLVLTTSGRRASGYTVEPFYP